MALQVDAEDVRLAPTRSPLWEETLGGDLAERWQGLRIQERALLLRRMAILDEAEFIEARTSARRARDMARCCPAPRWGR